MPLGRRGRLLRALRAPFVPFIRAAREIVDTLPTFSRARQAIVKAARSGRPKTLRVGIDIRPFYEPLTGVGWYLHHLLEELSIRDDVEVVLFGETMVTDAGPTLHATVRSEPVTIDLRGGPVTRFSRPIALAAYAIATELHRCDLFFGANYFLPRALSSVARRRVVTVHDLTFRRYPELLQAETLENLEREFGREVFRADAIICVSEATRHDLVSLFPIDPRKAFAIHSGLAPIATEGASRVHLPRHYLLFVSTIEPRKNVGALLSAFESLRDSGDYEGALVIVGKIGWKSEDVVRRMRESRWSASIHHLDYVERDRLAAIYAGAELFVFPSIYEGFGFPLLEAMAYGVPTIAARSSSLPEIGGEAAIYCDPHDWRDLADCIRRVLRDEVLRREMVDRGRARVEQFRWSRTAEETVAVFRKAAG